MIFLYYMKVWDTYAWTGDWSEINDWYPDPELKVRCVSGENTTPQIKTTPQQKTTTSRWEFNNNTVFNFGPFNLDH